MGIGALGDNFAVFRDEKILRRCKQKILSEIAFQFRRSNRHDLIPPFVIWFTYIISKSNEMCNRIERNYRVESGAFSVATST